MLLFNRYEYNPQTDLIGKGGFSRVYKAFDNKFKRYLALKIYKTNEFSERYGPVAEIHRVIELDHPNIARYLDIDEIEKEDTFGQKETIQVCVMELLEGGNLAKNYATHKDLNIFRKLLIDVLHGLSYLHKNGIIHRDIKPPNILIKNTVEGPVAKLTDFGISKRSDASTHSSNSALIVSIPYMAPEQLNVKKYGIDEKIHYNIDLWSLGVAVYEILAGEVLFRNSIHDSSEQVMTNIISAELPDKIKLLPAPFNSFVSQCVIKDAKHRIKTAEELLPYLQEKTRYKTLITEFQPAVIDDAITGENDKENAMLLKKQEDEFKPLPVNEQDDKDDVEETMLFAPTANSKEATTDQLQQVSENTGETGMTSEAEQPFRPDKVPASNAEQSPADDTTVLTAVHDPDASGNMAEDKKTDNLSPVSGDAGYMQEDITMKVDHLPEIESLDETIVFETGKSKELPVKIQDEVNHEAHDKDVQPGASAADNPGKITRYIESIHGSPHKANIAGSNEDITQEINLTAEEKTATPVNEQPVPGSGMAKERDAGKVSLFNRYDYVPLTDLIGKGGFSRVYKAFDRKLSRWVALKIYKTGEFSDRYSPIAEIKRVINLDHSNICRYLDIEEIEKQNPFGENEKIQVCVMELLDSGNFADFYHKSDRDPEVLKKLMQDVLNGIAYLHKNGIIHRDIKPANILIKKTIEGPVAKITDFGISKLSDSVNNNSSSALIVSIPYMAPEQLNPRRYGIKERISYNLDLWSLGVTMYEVMTGDVLFKNSEHDSSEQIMANIMAPELPDKINVLPQPFRSIVSHCIVKNANDRAQKAEELLVLLNSTVKDAEPKVTGATNGVDLPVLPSGKTAPSILVDAEPSATGAKKNEPKIPVSLNDAAASKDQWKKFTVVESTHDLENKARRHISYLKISIVIAAVIFIAVLFFYLFSKTNT